MLQRIKMIVFLLCFSFSQLLAQKLIEKTSAEQRIKWYKEYLDLKDQSTFKNVPWQFVGPTNISGRMTDVEVVTPKGENYSIYVAGASGGIWKTENEGISWKPVFEHGMSTAFGDLALDPQNQETIWAGTGECNIFRSSNAGAGVYVSKNGGKTWKHKGLTNTNTISRILVHPQNSDVVYVAAGGNEWTNSTQRGVYKTIDGGKSWEQILFSNEMTGAYDLVMHPHNPEILYASMWQRIRKKWNDPRTEADYTETGLYKTVDGGKSWKPINTGLPIPKFRGRIGIDLCKKHPETLYAFVDNYEKLAENNTLNQKEDAYGRPSSGRIKGATIYRSDNGGERWKQVSEQNQYMEGMSGTYGWVFGQVRVDPVNPDKVYALGLFLNVSVNGGKTFKRIGNMHMDHHGLWIDPQNTNYLVNVNDGGVAISYDGEHFRTFYDNLPLVQFYNVGMDMAEPFHIYGSIQDHFSFRGKVDLSKGRANIPAVKFESAPGGEGSLHRINPYNPNIVYSAGFYGTISRTEMDKNKKKQIMPPIGPDSIKLRGQWLAPFILSPHNPGIIYHGTQFVHRSMNEGKNWQRISPDLSYNHQDKNGDIPYQTIFTLSESPKKFGLLYAGTDDGRVWKTDNSGKNWEEINKGLPYRKWVSHIEASGFIEERVYMTQNGKRDDDFAAYVWKSEDYGDTWQSLKSNIPYGPVNVIREDPKDENILYVGTDYGVFISVNRGKSWQTLVGKLPTTYVHDIQIHPRDDIAVVATHGRGMWALDITIVRKIIEAQKSNKKLVIFDIPDVSLPYNMQYFDMTVKRMKCSFHMKEKQKLTVRIFSSDGLKVFEKNFEAQKGLNQYEWDLLNEGGIPVDSGIYRIDVAGRSYSGEREFKVKPFMGW